MRFSFVIVLLAACSVRISRPLIRGVLLDAVSEQPLAGVTVTDRETVLTDAEGRFELPAITYREFSMVGSEAPPLRYGFRLSKRGYQPCQVQQFSTFGGAGAATEAATFSLKLRPLAEQGDAGAEVTGSACDETSKL